MPTKNLRNKILSIVVSLALSFCLWVTLAGQDMSAVDVAVPLEVANLPGDLAIKSEMPATVTFQVLANAAQVRFLADRKPHLWLNVSSAREGHNVFPIPSGSLDLPRGVQVRKSTPSLIEFEAVRVTSKVVSIRPVIRGHPDPAYDLASVIIEPDMATVQGARELTDKVEFIATTPIDIDGLSDDATLTVQPALTDLDPALTVMPDEVRVFINLEERLAEKTFQDLPITLELGGLGLAAKDVAVTPAKASVSLAWPVSARLGLAAEADEVVVRADAAQLAKAGEMELPVLVVPPANVKVTAIDPVNVTVKVIAGTPAESNSQNSGASAGETSPRDSL